jgi:hypothetical protein
VACCVFTPTHVAHKIAGTTPKVHQLTAQLPVLDEALLRAALATAEEPVCLEATLVDTSLIEVGETNQEEIGRQVDTVYPRSYCGFYNTLLAGQRLWKRPPDDLCGRCLDYGTATARQLELTLATASTPSHVDAVKHAAVVREAGGLGAAHAESRALVGTILESMISQSTRKA